MTGRTILALAAALATATGGAAIAQQQQQQQQPWMQGGGMQGGQQAPFEARAGSPGENDERMRERLERAGFQRPRIVAVGVIEAMGPDGETIVFRIAEPAERRQGGMGMGPGMGQGMAMGQGMGMQPGMQQPGMGPMGTPGMQRPGVGPEMGGPGDMRQGMMAGQDRGRAEQDQRRTENLLADALEMAGYTRFERIAPAHLQASAPDGRSVTIVFDGGMFGQGQGQAMARQMQERQMQGQMQQGQMHGQMHGQMQGQMQPGPGMPQATGTFDPRALQAAPSRQAGVEQRIWRDEVTPQAILNQAQVRRIIEVHGLGEVRDLRRDGDTFRGNADWRGEEVEVVVDARTGVVLEPDLDPGRPEVDVDVDDAIDTPPDDETDAETGADENAENGEEENG